MKIIALFFLFLTTPLAAHFPPEVRGKILYLMHREECERAMEFYLDYAKQNGAQDFELLQESAIRLLTRGVQSSDPETQLMCMFGAGIANNAALLPVLERGLRSEQPKIQLAAIHFLERLEDDEANELIFQALASPFLIVRLEAALSLAGKKDPRVIEQLESLYFKVPEPVRPLFAQIASTIITPAATKFFEQLLTDPLLLVRLASIHVAGTEKREDLLPKIRAILTHPHVAEQEAAIATLALLKDESSKPLFQELAKKREETLRLSALKALYDLGEKERLQEIVTEAKNKNLFAIALLGEMEKEELVVDVLRNLILEANFTIQVNAAASLLNLKEAPPLPVLKSILMNRNDVGFSKNFSPGKSLGFIETVSSISQKISLQRSTVALKQQLLLQALEYDEKYFIELARDIFNAQESTLLSTVTELLINHKSEEAINLLKEMHQKAGAPFVRNHCNLALYQLNLEGPYEENLLRFVSDVKKQPLIRFEEEDEESLSPHILAPEQTSQLLIASFEALASKRSEKGLLTLIESIAKGNPKNKYALLGLLIRTTE